MGGGTRSWQTWKIDILTTSTEIVLSTEIQQKRRNVNFGKEGGGGYNLDNFIYLLLVKGDK